MLYIFDENIKNKNLLNIAVHLNLDTQKKK